MTRKGSTLSTLVTAAFALAAIPLLAQAKDKITYDPAIVEDEAIIVTPPERYITRDRTASGARIEVITVQQVVHSNDLDLRSDYDVDLLRERIRQTAIDACNLAERDSAGVSLTTDRECVREATQDAMAQADTLIAYKRGYAALE